MKLKALKWLAGIGLIAALVLAGSGAWASPGGKRPVATQYLAVPAAAFSPIYDNAYNNQGHQVCTGSTSGDTHVAPLFLPHNATVTALRYYFWQSGGPAGGSAVTLYAAGNASDSRVFMADCSAAGTVGHGSSSDTTIYNAVVDNENRQYFLELHWNSNCANIISYRVVIEYTLGKGR